MQIIRYSDSEFGTRIEQMRASSSLFDPTIEQRTREIVMAVRERGDEALVELTARFDKATLAPEQLVVTQSERFNASVTASEDLRDAIDFAHANIKNFSLKSLRKEWSGRNKQGAKVGEKYDPFQRVGIYIPGGTAPLVSTALMTVTLAKAAGCPQIIVCTPCDAKGQVNGALLHALNTAGATTIYRLGGAQAIAAMALGTKTVQRVQKVFGPGNAYVVAAKRLLFGSVAVDLLPGPSEVLVLADESADARFVAADLLAQAEHGSGHERVWLLTPSNRLLKAVQKEMERQITKLSRHEFIHKAIKNNGWLIQVKNMEQGIGLVNQIAPEHCEVMTRTNIEVAKKIHTAGAIFLGNYSPTVLGDYVAGPSHELPTGGAGQCFAGLTVDQFQRRTSVVEYDQKALRKSLDAVAQFAAAEGLDAHGRSAAIRCEKKGKAR
jgi:histidinol dehydrogenase